ncbi:hypothetical protein JZ751_008956 [Albula glossodonta]|uniref:Uncharacterized protein n=1 Tax=Albula glossodonta TaxID=121402 RepID=A0A8T2P256_9TELE|nr:hypothetical protein JZ751_008956 [Albula glossodonta]
MDKIGSVAVLQTLGMPHPWKNSSLSDSAREKSRGSASKAGGVRFSEEVAGAHSHVHFDDKLHDSVVMVIPEKDGNFLVKVSGRGAAVPLSAVNAAFLMVSHDWIVATLDPTQSTVKSEQGSGANSTAAWPICSVTAQTLFSRRPFQFQAANLSPGSALPLALTS